MRRLIVVAVLLLTACAQTARTVQPAQPQIPTLRLSPASFGPGVSLAQRLTVRQLPQAAQAQVEERSLDAQLEIEPAEVRLAAFALGQRVLTLRWDGQELQATRHPMLPAAVDAGRVLRDVQLVYWPLSAVAAALPQGWTVDDQGSQRLLKFEGQLELVVSYTGQPRWQGRAELDNRLEHYRLTIESSVLDGGHG